MNKLAPVSVVLLASLWIGLGSRCWASHIPSVTATVTSSVTGTFTYSYVVGNGSAAIDNIFEVTLLGLQVPILAGSLTAPPGWTSFEATGLVDWSSGDPSLDIRPGMAQSGFSFQSLYGPLAVIVQTVGSDPVNGLATDFQIDSAVGPGVQGVPEPCTFVLVALAGVVLCFRALPAPARTRVRSGNDGLPRHPGSPAEL